MLRPHVVSAIWWRNLNQYFSGVLGYVIIVAFVTVCAVMTFSEQFFSENLANLDQLTRWFPFLLLFLCPAITMTSWADERRQGTDAILFTLPATDLEITVGKFIAASTVYTIALLFSSSQLVSLALLGSPDWGVVVSTYCGYWLAGLALLAIGMFASSLTDSPTVAFVVGAMLCALPVMTSEIFSSSRGLEQWGFAWHLQDFASGMVSLRGVVYFLCIVVFMLYLNLIVIGFRHWSSGREIRMGSHLAVRSIALFLAIVCVNFLVASWAVGNWSRADLTAEKLFTLNSVTSRSLKDLETSGSPVKLTAYVSDEVPREMAGTKKSLLNLLRQYDRIGGKMLEVDVRVVEPNSLMSTAAISSGIEPRTVRSEENGRVVEREVFLGCEISGNGDVTIPWIDASRSLEYELTRGIASARSSEKSLKLGIVETDTHFAGPEIDGRRIEWAYSDTMEELKKMYSLELIPQSELSRYVASSGEDANETTGTTEPNGVSDKPERQAPDVLLVPDPSSLDDAATASLVQYMADGHPVILLADPLPFYWTSLNPEYIGVLNAPMMGRLNPQSPNAPLLTSSFAPKADGGTASRIMSALGVTWKHNQTAWNMENPHPKFEGYWNPGLSASWPVYYGRFDFAYVFVTGGGDGRMIEDHPVTRGLSEILCFYPGSITRADEAVDLEFKPILNLGTNSGVIPWHQLTMTPKRETARQDPRTGRIEVEEVAARNQITGEDMVVLKPDPSSGMDGINHVVAAEVTGTGSRREKAIIICDLDFVANIAREQEEAIGEELDNLRLLQNAIEYLAGNTDFISLRNRRAQPRTLTTIEEQSRARRNERAAKQKAAEDEAQKELEKIRLALEADTTRISEDESLNFIQKLQQASQTSMAAQNRFDRKRQEIERNLAADITALKRQEHEAISELENRNRWLAVMLAPLPALILGLGVFGLRWSREQGEVRQRQAA